MMKYKGYTGHVEYDDEAKIFHGEVLGIKDVVTFQGTTVDEIEQAFKDSVDDYLAFCKERIDLSLASSICEFPPNYMQSYLLQRNFTEKALIITSQKCYKDWWPSLWKEFSTNIPIYEANLSLHKRHATPLLDLFLIYAS